MITATIAASVFLAVPQDEMVSYPKDPRSNIVVVKTIKGRDGIGSTVIAYSKNPANNLAKVQPGSNSAAQRFKSEKKGAYPKDPRNNIVKIDD